MNANLPHIYENIMWKHAGGSSSPGEPILLTWCIACEEFILNVKELKQVTSIPGLIKPHAMLIQEFLSSPIARISASGSQS